MGIIYLDLSRIYSVVLIYNKRLMIILKSKNRDTKNIIIKLYYEISKNYANIEFY